MRFRFAAVLASALLTLAAAPEPVRLQPTSKWVVDYADNSCRLLRTFGEGGKKTLFVLESSAPGEANLLLIGKPLETYLREVPARFLPLDGATFEGRTARSEANGDPAILWATFPLLPADLAEETKRERERRQDHGGIRPLPVNLVKQAEDRAKRQEFAAKTTGLEIQVRHMHPLILETGSLGEPINEFDKCNRDSLRAWGVDPDLEDKIVRAAFPRNLEKWFSSADYPPGLAREGKESVVTVRVLVDATGAVTKCTSVSHFKEPEFSQITCGNIMNRAKFDPAELDNGAKVPSYYINHIIFRMEG